MARSIYERKAQKELQEEGYIVDYKTRPFRVPKGYKVDFFGRFDLMAVKFGSPLRWISIKGHAGVPKKHRTEVAEFWLPDGNQKEIWDWRKRLGWKKEVYHDGSWI